MYTSGTDLAVGVLSQQLGAVNGGFIRLHVTYSVGTTGTDSGGICFDLQVRIEVAS